MCSFYNPLHQVKMLKLQSFTNVRIFCCPLKVLYSILNAFLVFDCAYVETLGVICHYLDALLNVNNYLFQPVIFI